MHFIFYQGTVVTHQVQYMNAGQSEQQIVVLTPVPMNQPAALNQQGMMG